MIELLVKDLETAVRTVPKIWVRGNLLVLVVILLEFTRKTLWITGYIQGFYNNAIMGIILFIGMIAGLDLFRSYVVLSWISDLALDVSLSSIDNNGKFEVKPISSKNLVTGVFLASASFILWVSILVGLSLLNTTLRRLGLKYSVNRTFCYLTLMAGCRKELGKIFEDVIYRITHSSTVQTQRSL